MGYYLLLYFINDLCYREIKFLFLFILDKIKIRNNRDNVIIIIKEKDD